MRHSILLCAVLGVFIPSIARPQGEPVGPEFRVNTYVMNLQISPSVAIDATGGFVVVWSSRGQDDPDLMYDIYGQRYASSGVPLGPEFHVNSSTSSTEENPSVATDPSGDFVVVWSSNSLTDAVLGQRFASSGTPLGPEFRVNTTPSNFEAHPVVAADASGNFVVAWTSYAPNGSYPTDVRAQRFASSGAPLGPEFRVNTYTPSTQAEPSVAADPSGNFVVVWDSGTSVFGQRYASSGAPLGAEFQVPTYAGYQSRPAVAADASGNFVVAWQSDGASIGVFARRYAGSGAPFGPEFRVNTYTTGSQYAAAVAVDPAGNFVVTWASGDAVATNFDVLGQRYASSGAPLGPEFRVNTFTMGSQYDPAVAADPAGNFVVVWPGQGGTDPLGVFGQRYGQILPIGLTSFRVD